MKIRLRHPYVKDHCLNCNGQMQRVGGRFRLYCAACRYEMKIERIDAQTR